MPGHTLGDTVPNLEVETTHGKMKLHDYFNDSWTILFSHTGDLTPVCTAELAKMASYSNEFERRGVKILGLSCNDVSSHKKWTKDIEAFVGNAKVTYPIVADSNRQILKELNMVDPDKDTSGKQIPSRALHIINPDKKIRLSFLYPACTGRNMDEVLRVLDSLQRACKHEIATPVNWKLGILGSSRRASMTSRSRSCSPRATRLSIYNTCDSPISTEDDVPSVSFSFSVSYISSVATTQACVLVVNV